MKRVLNFIEKINYNYLVIILIALFISCEEEKIKELPDNISVVEISENLADSLYIILPPGKNIFLTENEFFDEGVQKNIVLTKESNVYVTFIDEGAGSNFKNTLGWYAYDQAEPPQSIENIEKNILFPNISKIGSGGKLQPGYTLQVGKNKFPAGTVIGFFLIVKGWENGKINFNKLTHYTDYQFNLGQKQQHILFKNAYYESIIVGFEDLPIDDSEEIDYINLSTDSDFNDILFSVSDNNQGVRATAFDLTNVIVK